MRLISCACAKIFVAAMICPNRSTIGELLDEACVDKFSREKQVFINSNPKN